MEKLVIFIENNKIIIQPTDYIEDGWFVEINGDKILLFEIPMGGGEPIEIGDFKTLLGAIRTGQSLT